MTKFMIPSVTLVGNDPNRIVSEVKGKGMGKAEANKLLSKLMKVH